jgi:hypothetical protein
MMRPIPSRVLCTKKSHPEKPSCFDSDEADGNEVEMSMCPAYFHPHRLPTQVDYEENEETSEEGGLQEELIGLDEEGNNINVEGVAKSQHCPVRNVP